MQRELEIFFVSALLGVVDDFQSVSESLTLMAGNFSRVCVNVIIEDDEVDEDTEEFTIGLANFNDQPEFRINTTVIIIDNGECTFIILYIIEILKV